MKKLFIGCMMGLTAIIGFVGCEQDKALYSGSNYLMFSDTLYQYVVQKTNEIFKVPVSATRAVNYDRNLAVEIIDKESNAVEGKHYRLISNTVTIKAGEMVANIEVQGIYDNIEVADSLGFTLRLIIPESEQWELYDTKAKVVMQKACPFDIHNFTGYCRVTSTFLSSDYMQNVGIRLITSEVVEGEENTIVLHGLYFDGYDTKIKFDRKDIFRPLIDMDKHICGLSSELFGTIHGDGNLRLSQSANYTSYYSCCQDFIFQYVTLSVDNKDGSEYGVVGTYINLIEWISEAEAEKLKEQGY
ncbi:MAG: DUF4984 domain-containing protein [Bacteroides sp.]|nr:DUF4984 domain-containing protein [Bacteroides sp.]